jgi:hypothetical protein
MLQRNAIRLRRLGNLLGCRDTEYVSPSPTPSPPDAHIASSSNMYGHVDDEEVCIFSIIFASSSSYTSFEYEKY